VFDTQKSISILPVYEQARDAKRTFGDLEKHLENVDGELNVDIEALERVRERKRKANHAD
jgi:hypothetical protein